MTNKTLRDYINLVENAQRESVAEGNLNEGVMDQLKRIYMMLVNDMPMGTPESEFLAHWQREIRNDLGKNIDIDTLAGLRDNFVNRYKTMGRRGDVGDWHREMGQGVAEGSESSLKSATMAAWNAVVKKHPEWINNYGSNAVKRTTKEIVRRHWENMDQDNIDGILFHIEHELQDLDEEQLEETSPDAIKKIEQLVRK